MHQGAPNVVFVVHRNVHTTALSSPTRAPDSRLQPAHDEEDQRPLVVLDQRDLKRRQICFSEQLIKAHGGQPS